MNKSNKTSKSSMFGNSRKGALDILIIVNIYRVNEYVDDFLLVLFIINISILKLGDPVDDLLLSEIALFQAGAL